MQENDMGEIHPSIDSEKCIDCSKCIKICPNNVQIIFRHPKKALASWMTDSKKRKTCASGGIATVMSEYIIKKKGVVYGTRYDEGLNPICKRVTSLEELEKLKGSKYVQSHVGDTFRQVKNDLSNDKRVLFIGTPCQIAGLISFLGRTYDNLITSDLICHGVNPMAYFKEEIRYIAGKKFDSLTDIRFRGNDKNNFALTLWKGNKKIYKRKAYSQYYFSAFLKAVSLRESCYTCEYAKTERISDITIGDFIGLGKDIPFIHKVRNVSVTTLNTNKSIEFWKEVEANTNNLACEERDYKEAVNRGPSLRAPFPRHELNKEFKRLYKEYGWIKTIRTVLKKDIQRNKVKEIERLPKRIVRKTLRVLSISK
jgi:coenzyme F420-reducing hydrogenase beta subunit